jgi:hypothetical protein
MWMVFVPHKEHIYGSPRPVTGIALLFNMQMLFIPPKKNIYDLPRPDAKITLLPYISTNCTDTEKTNKLHSGQIIVRIRIKLRPLRKHKRISTWRPASLPLDIETCRCDASKKIGMNERDAICRKLEETNFIQPLNPRLYSPIL